MPKEEKNKKTLIDKIKTLCSLFGTIVTIIAAILYIFADKVFNTSGAFYKQAIYIVIIGYLVVYVAAFVVFVIFKIKYIKSDLYDKAVNDFEINCQNIIEAIDEVNELKENLDKTTIIMEENIEQERKIIAQMELGQYVLNGREVVALEASVGCNDNQKRGWKIYIQTSLFILEKGPLEKTILWNLRKGVKYIYVIPNKDSYEDDYYDMLRDWYRLFSQFLVSREEYNKVLDELDNDEKYKKFWSQEYQRIFRDVGEIWNNTQMSENKREQRLNYYIDECKRIFKELIETHVEDEKLFCITVVAYETQRNKWKAIIKLPTQNINNEYYAFLVPDENKRQADDFIRLFRNRYKSRKYDSEDLSTLGGVLELDFSRIFS